MLVEWSKPDFGPQELNAATNSLHNFIGGNGPEVLLLEQEFAQKVGSKYAIATCNGTAALLVALLALKDKYNCSKVGVPSYTFVASANSSYNIFGESVKLLDVDIKNWNLSVEHIPSDIDLLMTVDVGGLSCDYDTISELEIPIVADSAESLGSTYKGQHVGTQADMHCFSLHRSKIVSCGEGGMITTDSEDLYDKARSLVNHGYDKDKKPYEYKHSNFGLNFRMCDVNAAIARTQLKKLSHYVRHRNTVAEIYKNEITLPVQKFGSDFVSNYFFFGVIVEDRYDFIQKLDNKGVKAKSWSAVHTQPVWSNKHNENLKNSQFLSDHVVLLPIYNTISIEEVQYVCKVIKDIV